jgi:hypothetical protein
LNHDAQIDDLVVVTAKHHADDVLANVVHVALHGREQDLALSGPSGLFVFHERLEMRDGLLHDPGALHDLRQEHFAGAEEIADHRHPVHQRAFDDVQRAWVLQPGLLGVFDYEVDHAVDQRVREPRLDRPLAPREVVLLPLSLAFDRLGQCDEPLRRIGASVEQDVFDVLEEIFGNLFVDLELACVDDAHVHSGTDRMVEERRVHRFAHAVVATEREAEIAHSAADERARAPLLDLSRRLDKVDRVLVVLLDSGGDRENVGVEYDVGRREARLFDEYPVRPGADLHLPLDRVRLPLFVEGHHDGAGTVAAYLPRLIQELRLAFFQADRVDESFALHALEARFENAPLRAVDHDRNARNLRLGANEIQEPGHRLLGVEHALIHVDVDDVRAVAYLLKGDRNSLRVVAFGDQLSELGRPGHVGALTHHDEVRLWPNDQGLEAAEARIVAFALGPRARRQVADRLGDGLDVVRSRATAATNDVDHPLRGEPAEQFGHLLRGLIVAAKGIGEARIGVTMHVAIGDPGELLQEGAHLLSA